jgi:hypothetical protein
MEASCYAVQGLRIENLDLHLEVDLAWDKKRVFFAGREEAELGDG